MGEFAQCLADGGPGYAECLGELSFGRERGPGRERAVEYLGDQLVEDRVGNRLPIDALEGHDRDAMPEMVSGQVVRPICCRW